MLNGQVQSGPDRIRVLHLLGSAVSTYYELLSTQYAQGCVTNARDDETVRRFEFVFAAVHATPDGPMWSFPTDLSDEALKNAPRLGHEEALPRLIALKADCCVPHMFCYPGMTTYRALCELLGIPLVGASAHTMALSTDKAQSRAVVAAAGVPVAPGEVLCHGQAPSMTPPFVLKPCCEDNSMGVSMVRTPAEVDAALAEAFQFDSQVICEKFIPLGREIRVAVLEDEAGEPTRVLPCLEYFLSSDHPIRTPNDKVTTDSTTGLPNGLATGGRKCPADVDDVLLAKLSDAAIRAHRALGCRDFSLYDFRVDPDGEIFFLEICPFCSFAPRSVVVTMAQASGDASIAHPQLLHTMLQRAVGRKPRFDKGVEQRFGMRAAGR